jgi:hypothetical protein
MPKGASPTSANLSRSVNRTSGVSLQTLTYSNETFGVLDRRMVRVSANCLGEKEFHNAAATT